MEGRLRMMCGRPQGTNPLLRSVCVCVCGESDGPCVSDPISAASCWKGQEESSAAIYSCAVTFNELLP